MFESWNILLNQYVDNQGRVNYKAWQASSNDTQKLKGFLEDISKIPTETLTDVNLRLALWINLYNALTISQVLAKYPIDSIMPKILGIPNLIAFLWFFEKPHSSVYYSEKYYSLNNIEHDILRREFNESRIHFALVCASIGCPLLRNEAYYPDRVQSQLEEDARRFINNPEKVRYDSEGHILYCSKIFKWYRKDFLKVALSIQDYICLYLPQSGISTSTPIRYLDYDWNLNQRIS